MFPRFCSSHEKKRWASGNYVSSCLPSALHAQCKALLCLRRRVKGWLCGQEWSVNAGASRALLWNTWVTPSGVILVLAGEHRYRTHARRVQACTLFVFFGCGCRKRLRLAFQISFVKIGGKMNLKKRGRTRGRRKPPRAFVLWHEPSKQCAGSRGGRHAAECTLTDPQAWNSTLALRSFRNSKRRRRNSYHKCSPPDQAGLVLTVLT